MRTKAPFKTTHEQNDSRRLDGALVPLVSGPVRLLNEPFKKIIHVPSLFQNHKSLVILAAVVAVWISLSSVGSAQEVAETIRVNTRVVFMDALVKDKRTGVPIADLKPENFEILDDGNCATHFLLHSRRPGPQATGARPDSRSASRWRGQVS